MIKGLNTNIWTAVQMYLNGFKLQKQMWDICSFSFAFLMYLVLPPFNLLIEQMCIICLKIGFSMLSPFLIYCFASPAFLIYKMPPTVQIFWCTALHFIFLSAIFWKCHGSQKQCNSLAWISKNFLPPS